MSKGRNVKKLREQMGMNRREFCDYYGIPYRTVQDWESEKRELPDYLLRLLKYRAESGRMMKSKDEMILDCFRQLTEENQMITLAYLAAVLSAPAASSSDRLRDDAPTA